MAGRGLPSDEATQAVFPESARQQRVGTEGEVNEGASRDSHGYLAQIGYKGRNNADLHGCDRITAFAKCTEALSEIQVRRQMFTAASSIRYALSVRKTLRGRS